MPESWERYLSPQNAQREFARCRSETVGAFEELRGVIGRAFSRTGAERVACLGAGVLNDLPYSAFVASGAELHLVDWLPGIIESGIGQSIVSENDSGELECIYCDLEEERAQLYCSAFDPSEMRALKLCRNYVSASEGETGCSAFQLGKQPHLYCEDISGGYASAFARAVSGSLEGVRSWRQAFAVAGELAEKLKRHRRSLSIPDGSIDFTVSSMVISQFEYEPYEFFAKQVAGRLGFPQAKEEKRLSGPLEKLRSALLVSSLEHHLDEITRITARDGVCLMAFEMFHYDPALEEWFLVKEMHQALGMIAERFRFDFSLLDAGDDLITYDNNGHRSRVSCLVLRPHSA